jgi:polyribonucleotide nucleotidyltransferase
MANGDGDGKVTKFIKELSIGFKVLMGFLTIAAMIAGGIWTINTTYASKGHVLAVQQSIKEVKEDAARARVLLAEESVKTLQQFQYQMQQEQQQRRIKTDVRYWTQLIDATYHKITDIENQLNRQPNNVYLKNRLKEEKTRLEQYKQRLNEILK